MKIAFISTFYGTELGGAELSVELLANNLRKNKQNINIFTTRKSLQNDSISLPYFNLIPKKMLILGNKFLDYFLARSIEKKLSNNIPDIFHVQDLFSLSATVKVAKKLKRPIVVTIRDDMPRTFKIFNINLLAHRNKIYKNALNQCDAIISISDFIKNKLSTFGINSEKIHTIYNIPPEWNFKDSKVQRKNKKDKIILLALGRLVKEKGFDILINAISLVINQYKNIKLIIIGEGPEKKKLCNLIKSFNLSQYVDMVTYVKNDKIPQYYRMCDIVLFPSNYNEPLGRVALESAICEKPIIATAVGGIPEIVKNKKTGLLISPKNHIELANAIITLIKKDKLRKKMGKSAKFFVRENFRADKIVSETIKIYNGLAKND